MFFVLEQNLTHAWSAQAFFWGVQSPKCTPVAPSLLLLFGANPRWEGTSTNIGRAQQRNAPDGAGPGSSPTNLLRIHSAGQS